MRPVDLPFSQLLGLRPAPAGADHLLELPFGDDRRNHVGTVHAAAQFALAESASAEFLLRRFPDLAAGALAVVRGAEVIYRQAATTDLHAFARTDDAAEAVRDEFGRRGRTFTTVVVELRSPGGATSFVGRFKWFLRRPDAP